MPDPNQIPYLLRLLEDDSPDVRAAVMEQFAAFGESLEYHLQGLPLPGEGRERRLIESFLREARRRSLAEAWAGLAGEESDGALLETGHVLISRFLRQERSGPTLPEALDALAAGFRTQPGEHDVLALAEYLFRVRGITGARATFHNPRSSDLLFVINAREGLPISLCSIYMLVARRLGLAVEGCNLPGHFLALAEYGGRTLVVDCYNGGGVVLDADLARFSPDTPVRTSDLVALRCDARVTLSRVLRNLVHAFRRSGDEQALEDASLLEKLAATPIP